MTSHRLLTSGGWLAVGVLLLSGCAGSDPVGASSAPTFTSPATPTPSSSSAQTAPAPTDPGGDAAESGSPRQSTSADAAASAPIVLPPGELPSPAATLPPAPSPSSGAGVATVDPVSLPQYVPPDISQSGIAIAVSGTRYTPGQLIATSSQAAPELSGFTAYLLTADAGGTITPLATGTVGTGGRFELAYRPSGAGKIISAVAQAGVRPTDPLDLDNVIARSAVVEIRPR